MILQATSYEGSEQRCFHHLFFCGNKLPKWFPAPGSHAAAVADGLANKGVPMELFLWGQAVVDYYRQQPATALPPMRASPFQEQPWASAESTTRQLRIKFQDRATLSRRLLNVDTLLDHCNSWRHTDDAGVTWTAACEQVSCCVPPGRHADPN